MLKRILALIFIFICTTLAWVVLGTTIFSRTYGGPSGNLESSVERSWGSQQVQTSPSASYTVSRPRAEEVLNENKEKITRTVQETSQVALPLESSAVDVSFQLDHRQKGLLWYSTYAVDFAGKYGVRNTTRQDQVVTVRLKFPAAQAVYDNLQISAEGQPLPITTDNTGAAVSVKIPAGALSTLAFSYRSRGMDSWTYKFGEDVSQVRDFSLTMKTNFKAVDFPADSLSPTEKVEIPGGWELHWKYKNVLTGLQIGTVMPEKLQPGPLAGQISFFAPVSLFFFFFVMFIITTIRGIDLHPMNYFFLATAFFAFHLLLAYLVDHISIHLAFVICSAVSIFLVITYLRLVVGLRFAAVEAGIAQLIYLVLFSYAFFFKGFTGLAVTIGSIITLFVVMQMTGRIKWQDKFSNGPDLRELLSTRFKKEGPAEAGV